MDIYVHTVSTVTEGYAKLFCSILLSSVWQEDDATRIVWIAMLALANKLGEVTSSLPGLAHIARVTNDACEHAIQVLSSPDPTSQNPTNEGRRIEKIERGWRIINYQDFRRRMSAEERREYKAMKQREYRRVDNSGQCGKSVEGRLDIAEAESKADADAEAIYRAYPKHVARPKALQAINRSLKKAQPEWLLQRTQQYASAVEGEDPRFIPHPTTWFNQERYNDDSKTWVRSAPSTAAQRKVERQKGEFPSNIDRQKLVLNQ